MYGSWRCNKPQVSKISSSRVIGFCPRVLVDRRVFSHQFCDLEQACLNKEHYAYLPNSVVFRGLCFFYRVSRVKTELQAFLSSFVANYPHVKEAFVTCSSFHYKLIRPKGRFQKWDSGQCYFSASGNQPLGASGIFSAQQAARDPYRDLWIQGGQRDTLASFHCLTMLTTSPDWQIGKLIPTKSIEG